VGEITNFCKGMVLLEDVEGKSIVGLSWQDEGERGEIQASFL
jgi:hypothetical protein